MRRRQWKDAPGKARTVGAALEDVALHLEVAVLGAQLDVGGEHHLDVLLLLGQRPRRASACRRRLSSRRPAVAPLRSCRRR